MCKAAVTTGARGVCAVRGVQAQPCVHVLLRMHVVAHTAHNRGKYCIKWGGAYYIVYASHEPCNVYLVQMVGALLARTFNGVIMYYHVIGGSIYCKYVAVLCK